MKTKNLQERWRSVPDYVGLYSISDLGRIKDLRRNSFLEPVNGFVLLENKKFAVNDLIQQVFINSPEKPEHKAVLEGSNQLVFKHFIPTPTSYPDDEFNSMKLWYVPDGFICVSPRRSFMQGHCKFVFPYEVGGNRAYICRFDEIQPLRYRQTRNAGSVLIYGCKSPVAFRKAIPTIYKRLIQAQKAHNSWMDGRTKLKQSYINNAIFKATDSVKPISVYNGTVYTLFVDLKCLYAEYRELIPQEHIMKLYNFVSEAKMTEDVLKPKDDLWQKAYGFTKDEFIELIEKCS